MTSEQSDQTYGLRRRSREMAVQLLFQCEFLPAQQEASAMPSPQEMLRRFVEDFGIGSDVADYGSQLFLGVSAQLKEIDAIIQAHSSHWKISRMGRVDLSVMRVAVYEMRLMRTPLPPNVAINEAVEIAKKYGSTDSGAFVNGILDHVARSL